MKRILTILYFLFSSSLGFAGGDDVGHGGGKTKVDAMDWRSAVATIGFPAETLDRSIALVERQLNAKKQLLPVSLIEMVSAELSHFKKRKEELFFIVGEELIPVTDINRCGYQGIYKVQAFTGIRPGSKIYFTRKLALEASTEEFARILFHELFRHVAGERLNCLDDFIHQLSLFLFDRESTLTKRSVADHWTLKSVDMGFVFRHYSKRNADFVRVVELLKVYEGLIRQEAERDESLIEGILLNPDQMSSDLLAWFLPIEMAARPPQRRQEMLQRVVDTVVGRLAGEGPHPEELTDKFKTVVAAMKGSWSFCSSHVLFLLNRKQKELARQVSLWRLRKFIDRLESDPEFMQESRSECL